MWKMPIKDVKELYPLWERWSKFLRPFARHWAALVSLGLLVMFLSLVSPLLIKAIIDEAIAKKDIAGFFVISGIIAGVYLAGEISARFKGLLFEYARARTHLNISRRVFGHIHKLSFSWFQDKSTGEHIYKITRDIECSTDFVISLLPQFFQIGARMFLTTVIVVLMDWKMAAFILISVPLIYIPAYCLSRKMFRASGRIIDISQTRFHRLQEIFSHVLMVKVFGTERLSMKGFRENLTDGIRAEMRMARMDAKGVFFTDLANKGAAGLVICYGLFRVIKGDMSLGSLSAISAYLFQLSGMHAELGGILHSLMPGWLSLRRVNCILDEKPVIADKPLARDILISSAQIRFDGVSFGYDPGKDVLRSLSFSIEPASRIALAGYSGCGKTTLIYLLLRLYQPRQGRIFVDNRDISDFKINFYKRQVGVALQEHYLWNDTIENNIRYSYPQASMDEVMEAARISGVDEFTRELPKGFATVIGENAVMLSEGQKQKIAIARALVKRPKILVFDEAMSSMDSASENRIISAIEERMDEVTLIIISHRLSIVMKMDTVCYLKSPQDLVIDAPKRLLANNEGFRALFSGQDKL